MTPTWSHGTLTGNGTADDAAPGGETVSTLFARHGARIDRIVSNRHASPPGFWYDQNEDEWVMVIEGSATIGFDDGSTHLLFTGDWVAIPAHVRHRVVRTDAHTVWLAIHLTGV